MNVQPVQQRTQNTNFGMRFNIDDVEGREARELASTLAGWLSPLPTTATAKVRGNKFLLVTIHKGDGQPRTLRARVSEAMRNLGSMAEKIRTAVVAQ